MSRSLLQTWLSELLNEFPGLPKGDGTMNLSIFPE